MSTRILSKFLCTAALLAGGCFSFSAAHNSVNASEKEEAPQAQLLEKLSKQLEQILANQKKQAKKLEDIEKKLKKIREASTQIVPNPFGGNETKYAELKDKLKKFGEIKEDWNKDKVEKYLQTVQDCANTLKSYSWNEYPSVAIQMLGPEHLPEIIEFTIKTGKADKTTAFLRTAIKNLTISENEKAKKLIADNLVELPILIDVVKEMKWEKHMKNQLIAALSKNDIKGNYTNFVLALASLKDKDTYPILSDAFIIQRNKATLYNAVKNLPGFDVDKYIKQAWNNSNGYDAKQFAGIAARHGIYDAFEKLIEMAQKQKNNWYGENPFIDLYRLTGFSGDGKKYADWYKKNKEQIFFDPKTKKYVVDTKRKPRGTKDIF